MSVASQGLTLAALLLPVAGAAGSAALGWRATLQVVAGVVVVVFLPLAVLARKVAGSKASVPVARVERLMTTLRRPGVVRLLLVLAVPPLVITAIVFHAVSLLTPLDIAHAEAATAISAMALSTVVGAPAGGVLAGHRPPGAVLATLSGALVASVGLLLLSAPLAAYGAFVMLGLAGGFYATANGALWAAAYGTGKASGG